MYVVYLYVKIMKNSFLSRPLVHFIFIATLGLIAYANTFNVPFHWDDNFFIKNNPIIENLAYFWEPSKAEGFKYHAAFKNRYVGFLTFALNYRLHGFNVTGYHVFNITIHVLNSMLVYLLIIFSYKTPFLRQSSLKEHSRYIALFAGLIFVSHPLQTEAVTYIFQRLSSLAAFFYLLSVVTYVRSRLSEDSSRLCFFYALSFIAAILAMKTKEIAFTLPFIIVLYEFFFFGDRFKKRVLFLLPLLLTLFIIPLTLIGIDKPAGEIMSSISTASRGFSGISRTDYLFTQFRVVVTYIRLLFFPINQNFDYDYPALRLFLNPQVFLSILFHLAIMGLSVYLFFRSRIKAPDLRIMAFGIFWFYIALSVESSIIPIPMAINEYRVYLPLAGVSLSLITAAFLFLEKFKNKNARIAICAILVVIPFLFSYITYKRNTVWKSEIRFLEDTVEKSPRKARVHTNLGSAYAEEGMNGKAIKHSTIALKLDPSDAYAHYNLGNLYRKRKDYHMAVGHYEAALIYKPAYYSAHHQLGLIYLQKGDREAARKEFEAVLKINPGHYWAGKMLKSIDD